MFDVDDEKTMIERFLSYLRYERGCSMLTVKNYGEDLKAFELYFKTLDDQLSWTSVDTDVIRDWMEGMMDKGNTATSVKRRLSAVRSFFRFALSRSLVKADPARCLKSPKCESPLPVFLSDGQMDFLLDTVLADGEGGYEGVLARTVIMTFYETGVRLAELCGLDNESVDFDGNGLKVFGKGSKERTVPFGGELKKTLHEYVAKRNSDIENRDSRAFFVRKDGKRVGREYIRKMVQKWLSSVSTAKKRTPHVLRHTFATSMLNHGADIESVRKLLGHERLSTTEIYTHTTFEQLKREYNNAHPRA